MHMSTSNKKTECNVIERKKNKRNFSSFFLFAPLYFFYIIISISLLARSFKVSMVHKKTQPLSIKI